jgi:hypothetical protein
MTQSKPNRGRWPRLAGLLALLAAIPVGGAGAAQDWPFERGWDGEFQRLRFQVSWLFLPAGKSIIQAWRPEPGQVAFRTEACSNKRVDLISKVRDRVYARATYGPQGLRPAFYRVTQYKGDGWRDITTQYGGPVVTRKHHRDKVRTFDDVPPDHVDALTALFALRRKPLDVGERYTVPVFDQKKAYQLVGKVLRREEIATPFGERTPTVVVKPELKTAGIFQRKGDMWIWFTDDASHVPVRMKSSIAIGSIVAELVGIDSQPPAGGPQEPFCMPELGPPGSAGDPA